LGFVGFAAALVASYFGIKAFGGMVGKTMRLYAVGIMAIGIASIMCLLFYIMGIGEIGNLSVQVEDNLRTIALVIFSVAGYMMYKKSGGVKHEPSRKNPTA
jgi:hypothetical protein